MILPTCSYAARRSRYFIVVRLGRVMCGAIAICGGWREHEGHIPLGCAEGPAGLDVRPGGDGSVRYAVDGRVELGGTAGVFDVIGRWGASISWEQGWEQTLNLWTTGVSYSVQRFPSSLYVVHFILKPVFVCVCSKN